MELPAHLFPKVVSAIDESVVITDTQLEEPGPRIVYVNHAFENMTGYTFNDVKDHSPRLLQGPDTDRGVLDRVRSSLETGDAFQGRTINYRKDGTPFKLEWRIEPIAGASGEVQYYMAIQRDVTEERVTLKRSRQLEHLQRVSHEVAVGGLNLDLVRQKVAGVAMEVTNAEAAVVEEPAGDEMVYRAVAGAATGHLDLRLPLDRSISGLCYRTQEVLTCDDAETDDRVRLKDMARQIGFRSAILVPLLHNQRCYGVLEVYAPEPQHFKRDHQQLLGLASDILAASLFDAAVFNDELRKRHLLLDAAPILIAYLDRHQRYVEANASHESLFRRPISEIRGKHVWEVMEQETYDQLRPYVEAALRGESVNFEVEIGPGGGEQRTFRGNLEPHYQSGGELDGCYVAIQDVSDTKRADTDYLTGLPNRRYFERLAEFLLEARERHGTVCSLLMLDIDYFKQINDRHGHPAGDEVLERVASIISDSVRSTDVTCRWGGEEFAILLEGSNREDAVAFTHRLMERIRGQSFRRARPVTASVGVAEAQPEDTIATLHERADRALYEAKATGRDRVVCAESGTD
jgi:diguanylate cyclase (GGDEF)-like protein/PAS domain S-box-containing protein